MLTIGLVVNYGNFDPKIENKVSINERNLWYGPGKPEGLHDHEKNYAISITRAFPFQKRECYDSLCSPVRVI